MNPKILLTAILLVGLLIVLPVIVDTSTVTVYSTVEGNAIGTVMLCVAYVIVSADLTTAVACMWL